MKYLYYSKMAKEMNVTCDFIQHNLTCTLPENTMDVLLKVCTRLEEHTFREDVYTRTLKYRRWNNELRPFRSLKKRVARMFWKRNSCFQTVVEPPLLKQLQMMEQCKTEEKDSETDSEKESIHSNWSELVPIETSNPEETLTINVPQRKRTVRNIVLVPYKPKPKDWGSWKIKSPYVTSTVASPILDSNNQVQTSNQNNEDKLTYNPHSPYYELVHFTTILCG